MTHDARRYVYSLSRAPCLYYYAAARHTTEVPCPGEPCCPLGSAYPGARSATPSRRTTAAPVEEAPAPEAPPATEAPAPPPALSCSPVAAAPAPVPVSGAAPATLPLPVDLEDTAPLYGLREHRTRERDAGGDVAADGEAVEERIDLGSSHSRMVAPVVGARRQS